MGKKSKVKFPKTNSVIHNLKVMSVDKENNFVHVRCEKCEHSRRLKVTTFNRFKSHVCKCQTKFSKKLEEQEKHELDKTVNFETVIFDKPVQTVFKGENILWGFVSSEIERTYLEKLIFKLTETDYNFDKIPTQLQNCSIKFSLDASLVFVELKPNYHRQFLLLKIIEVFRAKKLPFQFYVAKLNLIK